MAHLTLEQRYEIFALQSAGYSQVEISKKIGKDKSVISRELKRNGDGRNGEYRAPLAHKKAEKRKAEKPKKIHFTDEVENYVNLNLKKDFSPEQIVGYAKRMGIKCVSMERIYQHVWKDKKAGGGLYSHLRTKGSRYTKRGAEKDKRGQIKGRVDIDQRPSIVEQKERIGDLEIDLVIGKDHKGALLTINDRVTGMLKMVKVETKEAAEIEAKTIELLKDWKSHLHTITSDNGKEFANHAIIAESLKIDFYFAKPYHSWERGANENLNGLIRQYFPKKTSFENITQEKIDNVVNILNNRPRKRYDYFTPYEVFLKKSA
jgi:transposase, IS30 family